jgi:hypoxanthine-DNA glycosylase
MERSRGFPPVACADARLLILGSLPGARSIAEHQYYAHPQNVFWRIMQALFGIQGDYERRCTQLGANGIALWDVLHSSIRPGSMDADIQMGSAAVNDFAAFFAAHPDIRMVAFNGKKAEQLFTRFVEPGVKIVGIRRVALPSTSPAYASMPFSGKLNAWRDALANE